AVAASVAPAPNTEPSAAAAPEPAMATGGTSANANVPPVAAASSMLAGSASVTAPAASVATPATAKPVTKPAGNPAPAPEEPWYMQTWAWAAGAAVIVLLIVLAMLGRRRKPAAAAASKSASSLADRFSAPSSGDDHLLDDDTDQEQLLDQLAEHPDDIYLHLELVTLYYSRRDVEHFEAAAEAMHAHITDPAQDEWQDVLHMGEDLAPEHPLFDHHEGGAPRNAASGFDIDDYK